MSLVIDQQTLDDLRVFGNKEKGSIYSIYNRTHTRGGAELLEQLFRYPLANRQQINDRSKIIRYFMQNQTAFPFKGELFDAAEQYLSETDNRKLLYRHENDIGRKFNQFIGADNEYQQLLRGLCSVVEILIRLQQFLATMPVSSTSMPLREELRQLSLSLQSPALKEMAGLKLPLKPDFATTALWDKIIRQEEMQQIRKIFYGIYMLDVLISAAAVAKNRGFVTAEATDSMQRELLLEGVYHPQLPKPVSNNLTMLPGSNIVFLTGANMAGKSTFMKSVGIAMFLAHIGFPVPAARMVFSVCDALLTTINLPDNLAMGYSHFYTEVLRVKKMAQQLKRCRNLFIIFDELFRGTNVKDAGEATIEVTAAFASQPNCMFIVSTHIMEAGEELAKNCSNIQFLYLPSEVRNGATQYSYQLQKGISADRHGMIIIQHEGILEMLEKGKSKIRAHEL
jgi:DNA mismatch repair ATPase MutS